MRLYNSAIEKEIAEKKKQAETIRLAEVTELAADGRAKVTFYGESTQSGKLFPYLSSYVPEVGDQVALAMQGDTYIILGAFRKTAVVEKYALKIHTHEALTKDEKELQFNGAALLPSVSGQINIGSSSSMFDKIYLKTAYFNGTEFDPEKTITELQSPAVNGTRRKFGWNGNSELIPDAANVVSMGSSAKRFLNWYVKNAYLEALSINGLAFDPEKFQSPAVSGTRRNIGWSGNTALEPSVTDTISFGSSSKRFLNGHFKKIFLNGEEFDPDANVTELESNAVNGTSRKFGWNGNSELVPDAANVVSMGSSAKRFLNGCFKNSYIEVLYLNGTEFDPVKFQSNAVSGTRRYIIWNSNHTLEPSSNEVINLGSTSKQFLNGYFYKLYLDGMEFEPTKIKSGPVSGTRNYLEWSTNKAFTPNVNKYINLGAPGMMFLNVYAKDFYADGSVISTSDRRKKKNIRKLPGKFREFFRKLKPVSYKFRDGSSGRCHTGFIAQDVQAAMQAAGISPAEFGGLVIDESGNYSLRYAEFISIQTAMIQELQDRMDGMERTYISQMNELLRRVDELERRAK